MRPRRALAQESSLVARGKRAPAWKAMAMIESYIQLILTILQ